MACEVKAEDDHTSPERAANQKRFRDRVRKSGGLAFVAKSVKDVLEAIA